MDVREVTASLPWASHIKSATDRGVTVSVAALSVEESRAEMGIPLDRAGIQPVWIQVENREEVRYYIPPILVDDAYFAPLEAAWTGRSWFSKKRNQHLYHHFVSRRLPNSVEPGATVSGFVFTNLEEGVKYIGLELIGGGTQVVRRFAFLATVPGLKMDFQQVEWDKLYAPQDVRDLDDPGLRAWLEKLPCCTKGPDLKTDGDPLNIALIGATGYLFPSLARRGWHVTETVTLASSWQTIRSSVFGSRYRYAPISPLYLFDRKQDIALQKPRANVDQRNHMRLWMAPVTMEGVPVWVGQISRDIGVRFSRKTITTHKVDPDMDETRWYLMQDLFFSQGLKSFAFVKGVGASTPDAPRHNYTGDPYYTDGLRIVLWMSDEPITYHHISSVLWEVPPAGGRDR